MHTTYAAVKLKYTSAVLYQLSYQTNRKLVKF